MIEIRALRDGFYRCGVRHGAEPTRWPDDRFTAEELARLQAEPMLVVRQLADPLADRVVTELAGRDDLPPAPQPARRGR